MSGRKLGIVVAQRVAPLGLAADADRRQLVRGLRQRDVEPRQPRQPACPSATRAASPAAADRRSIPSPATAPPPSRASIAAARRLASGMPAAIDAALEAMRRLGLRSPSRRAVRRMRARLEGRGLEQRRASSSADTSLSAPPMTPASAIGRSLVADDEVAGLERALDCRRASSSSRRGRRAGPRSPPRSLSASNACSGWPSSSIT